jgi:primosomal protein N'
LQQFLHAWRAQLEPGRASRVRWSLDVDPLDF